MARRTVHIPDELDELVLENTTAEDSYSGLVQTALREKFDQETTE
jgi:hypothetical protein